MPLFSSNIAKTNESRELIERHVLILEERYVHSHTTGPAKVHREPAPISTFRSLRDSRHEDMDRIAARGPEAPDHKKWENSKSQIRSLAVDSVYAKLAQARAEADPQKRLNILVDAQMLMTEFLNIGRDPQLAMSSRDAVRITLKFYLQEVRHLAPQCQDLSWVTGSRGTPYESYQVLEKLVKNDPSLASTYGPWEARQKALGLR